MNNAKIQFIEMAKIHCFTFYIGMKCSKNKSTQFLLYKLAEQKVNTNETN